MIPEKFVQVWTANDLTERAGAQAFIEDLCELLQLEKPRSSDDFCYEKGAIKDSGKNGWADVWKRDHFGWENKKTGGNLTRALAQLREYAGHLGNPPLLVVCDRERIEIHTVFRGYPDEPRTILLPDIGEPQNLQILRWVFTDPDKLKPLKSCAAITAQAAGEFSTLATAMRERGIKPQIVAHFLTQCIFCMFAEDEGLLNANATDDIHIFTHLLKATLTDEKKAANRLKSLFLAMQNKGGEYGNDDIHWFNGGLFKKIEIPELTANDLAVLFNAAHNLDWRAIDPTIFGTLFERGLDPSNRAQLGAHYTDVATIKKIIDPLITEPLTAKWQIVKAEMLEFLAKEKTVKTAAAKKQHHKAAQDLYFGYLEQLRNFRVLDAACGSGNFLYLSLHALKDLEHAAQLDAETLGFQKQILLSTGTDNILGMEINEYAAELARVTVWIGDLQWSQRNGRLFDKNPILRSLDGIQHKDALLNSDGTETKWAKADVIVGNPPFLGDKKMLKELGDDYVAKLRKCYKGRVAGGADLVCYWFDKARKQIESGKTQAAGLVSTNSIRGGSNRTVLDNICKKLTIFEAWSDENWFDNGAAVRVSMVCFGVRAGARAGVRAGSKPALNDNRLDTSYSEKGGRVTNPPLRTMRLNGQPVAVIHADLTAGNGEENTNITQAKILLENAKTSFIGTQKSGAFDVTGEMARVWLTQPNPNGKPNSEVVKPWSNGMDITRRSSDTWIIDFGVSMTEADASLFELPFEHILENVKPVRIGKREEKANEKWWIHQRSRPELRKEIAPLKRFIATPRVSKHRFFVWLPVAVLPDTRLTVIARSDDTTFGILHSRFHQLWSLATCSWHGVGNDPTYNAVSCFETFPFPNGLTPADNAENVAISDAAIKLNQLREAWLNPEIWVDWVISPAEETAGFPKRPIAKVGHEADLKKRTLTNLYNLKPNWLKSAHEMVDKAVARAYDWDDYTPEMADEEILRRLLKLNLERAGK